MTFSIKALSNTSIVSGKIVTAEKFAVVDSKDEPVLPKLFDTEAEAQTAIDGLGNLSEGTQFAEAQFPGMGDKAKKGKANVVAEYLDWVAAGRPVKELPPEEDKAEEAPVAEGAITPAVSEEEQF